MVYLVADSAEVTVLRSVASTAYGTYTLNVPEGIDLEDIHQFDAPGNQLGYVSTLTKRRVGRFFRRFIRGDVTVTAANPADPDWVADSDVDAVLREAEERVSGDFFLESDITLAGLGSWRPFVDFNIGDIVNVEIWGQVVQLPVTRIEPIVSDHTIVDWRVHVGGQLISDDDARIAENQVIYRALVEDRRDLAGMSKQVSQAVDIASRADSKSDVASKTAKDAKQVATTANSAAAQAQRSADGKSTVFYGATTPSNAKAGDAWFKDLAGGGTVLMQYVNGKWVEKVNAKAIDDKLAANDAALADNDAALTELNNVTLPGLKSDLEQADALAATEVASTMEELDRNLRENAVSEVTANQLWANGLAAKSIITNRILVAGNGNMLPEISSYKGSDYPNLDPYEQFGKNSVDPSMWLKGKDVNAYIRQPLKIVAGQKYRMRYQARASVNWTSHYLALRGGDLSGPASPAQTIRTKVNGSTNEGTYLVADGKIGTGWGSFDITFEPSTTEIAYIFIYANHPNGTDNPNYQWFTDVRLEKMTGATLIEDGAITTGKIAADAVTANAIASDAVTANAIKAGEITGEHIEAGSITSREMTIENGFIKNAMIGNGEITNAKIANLDAGKITAGTIDANRIGAKTITGSHLAVDTIEANQIKANVFTQVASNVIPLYPGTTKPAWTINADWSATNPTAITDGDPTWYRFNGTRHPGSDNVVEVDPDIEYVFSVWVHGTTGSVLYVELRDQDGEHAVESGTITGYGNNNGARYLIENMSLLEGWRKITTKIKLKKEARFVRIGAIYGNHPNGVSGPAYLADMRLYPDVASQTEVDARQDKAIFEMQEYVDQMMGTFYSQSAAYAKKFNELSEPMSGGLVAGQDEPGVMTTTTSSITCLGSWTGHILVHTVNPSGGGIDVPGLSVGRHEVTGSSRTFSIPSGRTGRSGSVAIHWFKRPGRAYVTDLSAGETAMPEGEWVTVSSTTVATGSWNLSATVGWQAATNHSFYGVRALVAGSVVAEITPRSGLGPLLPVGNGYRTQTISASGDRSGRTTTVQIQAYVNNANLASQRRIRRVNATLDWTKLN